LLDLKGNFGVVEKDDTEGTSVIFVDDAGTDVDEVLGGETGPAKAENIFKYGSYDLQLSYQLQWGGEI
jgi:hypothetical protein